MKVSIITPSLNQARFIERTIQSVLAQRWSPLEHFVIDGSSTDGTVDILRRYDGQVQWISEPDKGQSDAINKGIRASTGDVIGWLNSDDVYYPGAVNHAVQFFGAHPDVDAVYGMGDYIADDDSIIDVYPTEPWDVQRLKNVCFICQPAVFFRRSIFDRYGYLDTSLNYCMDYEYWLRLGHAGAHFGYLQTKLAGARMYVGNKTINGAVNAHTEILDMFRRRFGRVPDSWLFGYAHAVEKKQVDMNAYPMRFLFGKGLRTIAAAVRWNRRISLKMSAQLSRAALKNLIRAGPIQTVPTDKPKPSWWWS